MIDETALNNSEQPKNEINFATVTGVFEDGLTLLFDGETEPTQKHYKCNAFAIFKVNDRVRVIKDSGTYVVEYAVGNPKTSFNADTATNATNASNADNAQNSDKLNGKSEGNLNVGSATSSTTATYFSQRHTGSSLSFFNGAMSSKRTVYTLTSTPTVDNLRSKLNEVIDALKGYNLL